jgi:hypothetical protein
MRTLALVFASLAGLAGCVYVPYYGYVHYPPGPVGARLTTDPEYWPNRFGAYYYRYPSPYPYPGYWQAGPYYYRADR